MIPQQILNSLNDFFTKQLSHLKGDILQHSLSGGSINEAYRITKGKERFFLKYNHADLYPGMFEKEAAGLKMLHTTGEIDVPEVIHFGNSGDYSFLLLTYIEQGKEKSNFWMEFAKQLAALHSHKAPQFGLDYDNYMGSLYQHNTFHNRWINFFIQERLERQVRLARDRGNISSADVSAFERLYKKLEEIFPETKPSLVHGDLWSGNFMINENGLPSLIDPAVYYGHPEVDIAMSTLFGGFADSFYETYNQSNPLEKGWQQRLDYYNLYPLMIHVNLFGESYLRAVRRIIQKF
ncbi:MAG TPA: fructosamine kinase family protein [Bacteroidales bacterium]|jgi:fructosamine-3-kinase|nr:fructosamine kinase family protein [Bacteroidales bacterium]HQO08351.1 fructosamine kinase family protein [Bacteroidales bacterium]HQP54429.1 fructosamine kinase family protein [Bacteroidales bacterium]